MIIDFNLILESLPIMLKGIGITFQLLIISGFLGLILAIFLLLMRMMNHIY